MARAKTALLELKPDVLLLQEVRDWKAAEEVVQCDPKARSSGH